MTKGFDLFGSRWWIDALIPTGLLLIAAVLFFSGGVGASSSFVRNDYFSSGNDCFGGVTIYSIKVWGASMYPSVSQNDSLIAQKYIDGNLSVGSIVVANSSEFSSLAHRIVGFRDDGSIILKGDNNPAPDDYHYTYSNVKYVVCGVMYGKADKNDFNQGLLHEELLRKVKS